MSRNKKEEIKGLIEEYPKHFFWKVKKKYPKAFQCVRQKFASFDSFSEQLYLYIYEEDSSVCSYQSCDQKCRFRSFSEGYLDYCSNSCANKNREIRECIECGSEFEVKKSKDQKLCSRDCWEEWNQRDVVQKQAVESRRETCREKYGKDHYTNVEQTMKTKEKRYGDPTYSNPEKGVQTKKEKYGENFDKIVEKVKKTKEEKYEDENYCNLEKIKETNKEKYGVSWYFQTEEFKEKAKDTKKDRYGDENYNNKEQIIKTNRRRGYKLLTSKLSDLDIEPLFGLEDYRGLHNNKKLFEYPFCCSECGFEFEDTIGIDNLPKCPKCNPVYRSEKEVELFEFLFSVLSDDTKIERNIRDLIDGGEIDIYIPEKNVAIEFNGLYWHSETVSGRGRNYHLSKTEECEKRGIQLIHIFENEWENKKRIVKNRIKHILGVSNEESIYARDCGVREIDSNEKNTFLDQNHLQGKDNSSIKLGLCFQDELISVMTFSKRRVALGGDPNENPGEFEMSRFCSSRRVVGAAGKLFSYFVENFDPVKVVSYADRRWTMHDGSTLYDKLGFEFDRETQPSYWYFQSNKFSLYHRFSFRKNVLDRKLDDFDPGLTEWENMQMNGYDRIWDCGNLKYVWERGD